jgi:hypothetical protein
VTLSSRNQKALAGLHSLAREGWDRSPNARRAERSGLTPKQWRGAVAFLIAEGLVERAPGTDEERACGVADALRLTPAGISSLGMGGHGSGRGGGQGSGIPLGSWSSVSQVEEKKEEEPTNVLEEGAPIPMPAGRGGGHGSRAGVHEIRVLHDLSPEARAFFALLAHRDLKPQNALAGAVESLREPPTSDPPPVVDYPPPECCGAPMKLTPGSKGWFWGCVLWQTTGCRGLSPDEARALWIKAQEAEEAARKKEEERARRERERIAALNDARPSLLSDPGALERVLRGASRRA